MIVTDCPLCDGSAVLEAEADALDCEGCGVRLELAPDRPVELPLAA